MGGIIDVFTGGKEKKRAEDEKDRLRAEQAKAQKERTRLETEAALEKKKGQRKVARSARRVFSNPLGLSGGGNSDLLG